MKLKFQRERRTRIVFQNQKGNPKAPNFQENLLAFQLRTAGNYGASSKVELGFYGTFNGSAEGRCKKKKRERGRKVILNQGRIENPVKSR